tara:strand:- start:10682 stop:11257 length:576 start_codon:yes stop_codon:yes gene_type:complete
MSTEMRYWKRVGFAVSKGQALELIDRLADKPHGSVLDDDLEEFDSVGGDMSPITLSREIEMLWERDYDPKIDMQLDESINWIIVAMEFERNKKQYVKDLRAEGMSLEDAKEKYEFEKADIVRKALDLPDVEEVQEMIDDQQKPRDGRGNELTEEQIAELKAKQEAENEAALIAYGKALAESKKAEDNQEEE